MLPYLNNLWFSPHGLYILPKCFLKRYHWSNSYLVLATKTKLCAVAVYSLYSFSTNSNLGYCGFVNVQMAQNSLPHFLELSGAYMYAGEMLEEDYRDGVGRNSSCGSDA